VLINYLVAAALLVVGSFILWFKFIPVNDWSADEIDQIDSLWIERLSLSPPPDRTNLFADNHEAQLLGLQLFFDKRLSANGLISCSSCHQPNLDFTDGQKTSIAIGTSSRNAPSLIGASYSPWFYWDGRKDSQWSQALSPLEDQAEHGGNRVFFANLIASNFDYRKQYEDVFGALPDLGNKNRFPNMIGPFNTPENKKLWANMLASDQEVINTIFANIGKALAAYQRLLTPGPSRFDHFVSLRNSGTGETADPSLTAEESRGLRLFIGKAGCTNCHNGPLFSNNSFHNTGLLSSPGKLPDLGRVAAVNKAKKDPFNCLGAFSNNNNYCMELLFTKSGKELVGAFRTPSLRNLKRSAPYGHAGQQQTLTEVINHYDKAPDAMIGHNEAKPLELWPWERWQLEAFLESLDSPPNIDSRWLAPLPKNKDE